MEDIRLAFSAIAAFVLVLVAIDLASAQAEKRVELMPLAAERERTLKPQDTFQDCEQCPEMVVVPAGSFLMGSPANEPGARRHRRPAAPRDDREGLRSRQVCRHFRRMGRLPARRRLQRLSSGGPGLGSRQAASDQTGTMPRVTQHGCRAGPAGPTVCSARPNGNTSRAPTQRRRSGGARRSRPIRPTMMAGSPTAAARRANSARKPCPWIRSNLTHGAYTRFTATFGNGQRIAGMKVTTERRPTARPGSAASVVDASCAVGPGSPIRLPSARPSATGATCSGATGTKTMDSELPERLFHLDLPGRSISAQFASSSS
jgi:hypothetical protein